MNIDFCEKEQFFCFIDISVSIAIEISDIDFCEREQSLSFCFIDIIVSVSVDCVASENIDFYEKKQFCFFVDDIVVTDEIVDVVVTHIDALILIASMIKKKKKST